MLEFIDKHIDNIIIAIGFIFSTVLTFIDLGIAGGLVYATTISLMLLGSYNEIPDIEYRTDHDELWKLASRSN